jgi:hypothetical protein
MLQRTGAEIAPSSRGLDQLSPVSPNDRGAIHDPGVAREEENTLQNMEFLASSPVG